MARPWRRTIRSISRTRGFKRRLGIILKPRVREIERIVRRHGRAIHFDGDAARQKVAVCLCDPFHKIGPYPIERSDFLRLKSLSRSGRSLGEPVTLRPNDESPRVFRIEQCGKFLWYVARFWVRHVLLLPVRDVVEVKVGEKVGSGWLRAAV